LDELVPVDVVFGYSLFVGMPQKNVTVVLHDPDFNEIASLRNVNLTTFTGYTPGLLSPRSSFMGQRKLIIFLGGRPTDFMCVDSIRLMRLKVVLTSGRWA
jgi:hypothetical protein